MKRILSLLLIASAIALISFACKRKEPPPPPSENVFVYTFAEPATKSVEDSKKLIEKFLGSRDLGNLYKSDDNTIYFTSKDDVSETFENDLNNGNFTFNRSMKQYMGTNAPQLPAREEAIRRAEEFLNNNGLMPKNRNELTLAHYGGLRAAAVIDGKTAGPVIDKLVTVTYGRKVDDVSVYGPGSKVVVHLGNKGEVMGAIYRWRELNASSRKQVQAEEMISQQEAEELAKRQIMTEFGQETSYRILGSRRGYYDNNAKLLQPVYTFEVEINMQQRDQHVKPFTYLCVIPLLRNSPEPLNLTAIDPRAKEAIKLIKRGETPTGEKKPID
ncbi:MAG TPA: hypothetical protein VGW76_21265 [Pyrinomonadaceae bacterium]|nr:hypothetical protein [Pyrinomonadaceae bacterium]